MDALLLIARIVLCGVLLAAAFGKFADLHGARQAMRGFGVPENLAPIAGVALPVVELLVGLALIPVATARWAAVAALLLMLVFVAAIAWNMAQGRTPDCHCFGQLHSEPAGPRTLARNGVLALVAAFVVVGGWNDPGPAIGGWLADRSAFEVAVLLAGLVVVALIALLGWLVVQLMTQAGRLIERLEVLEGRLGIVAAEPESGGTPTTGLPVGSVAPEFGLPDLSGAQVSLRSLRATGQGVLLFFTNPGCEPCSRILASIPAWQQRAASQFELVVVSRGSAVANEEKAREYGLSHVLLQEAREVNKAYGVESTPSAVVIRPDGTIGSPVAGGANAVTALVEQTLPGNGTAASPASGLAVGQEIPPLTLATLAGTTFAGLPTDRESVLLFWSPTCGYCQRFVPDLLAWEAARTGKEPNLVIVSTGDAEAIRAHGFASTVLLDGGTGTSGRFGSRGTPSAVRVDARGRIASPVAHGAPSVMALLRSPVSAATAP